MKIYPMFQVTVHYEDDLEKQKVFRTLEEAISYKLKWKSRIFKSMGKYADVDERLETDMEFKYKFSTWNNVFPQDRWKDSTATFKYRSISIKKV